MHFDDLLKVLGELGRYQQIRLFYIYLVAIVCAFHAMNMVFVSAKPDYKCHVSKANVSDKIVGNTTEKDFQDFLQSAGKCEIYDEKTVSKLTSSGRYTLNDIITNNVTVPKNKCTEWDYSREVYGPTIVTQVCTG